MERSKSQERERTIYLATLNNEIEKALTKYKREPEDPDDPEYQELHIRLDALVNLAQKAGRGLTLKVKERDFSIDEMPDLVEDEVKQGERGIITFTFPGIIERRILHRRALRIKIEDNYLYLESSKGEIRFLLQDVLSIEAR